MANDTCSIDTLKEDFDNIAQIVMDENIDGWNHNNHYYPLLSEYLPLSHKNAVDIGCGDGDFSAILADHFETVVGMDISEKMLDLAKANYGDRENIKFLQGDFFDWEFEDDSVDLFVSIASMHHLDFDAALGKIYKALAPRGRLIVLDLYKSSTFADKMYNCFGFVSNKYHGVKNGMSRSTKLEDAWNKHEKHDDYMFFTDLLKKYEGCFPTVEVKRLALFRYMAICEKHK